VLFNQRVSGRTESVMAGDRHQAMQAGVRAHKPSTSENAISEPNTGPANRVTPGGGNSIR